MSAVCFIIFLSFLAAAATAAAQLPPPEILALLEFRKGIIHDPTGYIHGSWNEEAIDFNGCPSSWNGVVCDGATVAAVVLENLGLVGRISLAAFRNLPMLVKLSLKNNSISGKLAGELGGFKCLQSLDISDNLFSGTVPDEIGRITTLQNLSLAGNGFAGRLPAAIGDLAALRSLDLSRNNFSGPMPSRLTDLRSLVSLNLSFNGFSRRMITGLAELQTLEELDFSWNKLEGGIDWTFLLESNTGFVDLSGNSLISLSPKEMRFLSDIAGRLKHLNLSHNQLTGSLVTGDDGVLTFGNLRVLDLSHNQLSGELPGFNYAYNLEVLRLGSNKFSGLVPRELLQEDSLVIIDLDLSSNNFSGRIGAITSTTLQYVNLSLNSIAGELPLLTGACVVLDLSSNKFMGNLSSMEKWGSNIEFVDLSKNKLEGSFPPAMSQLLRLNHLNLSHNRLAGLLPANLSQYGKLAVLDLGSNAFSGPLTAEFLLSSSLQELHLQRNSLQGAVLAREKTTSSQLQILDLSENRLNGTLHLGAEFKIFAGLQVLDVAGNQFSGKLPAAVSELTSLVYLDVSGNRLVGLLPETLPHGLQFFNGCFNDFSGILPKSFRKFPESSFRPGNPKLQLLLSSPGGENITDHGHKRSAVKLAVIAASTAAVAVVILALVALLGFRRRREVSFSVEEEASGKVFNLKSSRSPESRESRPAGGRLVGELHFLDDGITLTAEQLSQAPAEVLGRSSHGTSYKATLDNGVLLTVKWLREGLARPKKEFSREAHKFSRIRHPNVVPLRAFYWGPTPHEKLLLFDFVSPASLAAFLYDRPGRKGAALTWSQRLKIAVDTARGLNYLHLERGLPHGNLKATNILLDGLDLSGRLADYGLHKLMTSAGVGEQVQDAAVLGYWAPELARKPAPSFKADVYALGVVLLELLTGRCAGDVVTGEEGSVDLTDWVQLRVAGGKASECFELGLLGEAGAEKAVKEVLALSLRCVRPASERPGIASLYEELSSL